MLNAPRTTGPATSLTAATLEAEIAALISSTPRNALIATTHWLDGHGDHAALGNFVRMINEASADPRSLAFAVIHAQTGKDQPYADCWYPGPTSPDCTFADQVCADENPGMLSALREFRLRPDWPGALPDDADYGSATHLCLPDRMVSGPDAVKLAAIESYASQAGFAIRDRTVPPGRGGMVDANGYLISFVRSTEAFVHVPRR